MDLSRQSHFTRDYSALWFSNAEAYEKGWITVAEHVVGRVERLVGFSCVRHKVREPETMVYFLGVDREFQRQDIGSMLIDDVIRSSPHSIISLNCAKANVGALDFYRYCGFVIAGDSAGGTGFRLTRERKHDLEPTGHERLG